MKWSTADAWVYQLHLLEDSTQILEMEPGLHNTYTTFTVILNGKSLEAAHLSKYNNKLYQAQTTHKTSLLLSEIVVYIVFFFHGFIAQHNRSQTHSHTLHPH